MNKMTSEEQIAADAAAAKETLTKEIGWRANLPEELQKDPSLESFKDETEMISMPINVAKSFIHTKKMVGADTIKIPKTDEEWSDVYTKLGRPETQELYNLSSPEGINPALKDMIGKDSEWFRELAHKQGLSDNQATALFQEYAKRVSDTYSKTITQSEDETMNNEIQLRTEFGSAYEGKNILGDRALEKLGGSGFMEFAKALGLSKHIEFNRFKFALGNMMAEDLGLDKATGQLITSKESLQEQIAELYSNPAYLDATHAEHKVTVTKVTKLMEQLHGTKALPVTIGTGVIAP